MISVFKTIPATACEPCNSLSKEHFSGPMVPGIRGRQFRNGRTGKWELSIDEPDNCVIIRSGKIVKIRNFLRDSSNQELFIIGNEYKNPESFFSFPIESSSLSIFKCSRFSELMVVPLKHVEAKAMHINFRSEWENEDRDAEYVVITMNMR